MGEKINDHPSMDQVLKALSAMVEMESFIATLLVLAVEYEAKTIQPDRFARRTHELLVEYQRKAIAPTHPQRADK